MIKRTFECISVTFFFYLYGGNFGQKVLNKGDATKHILFLIYSLKNNTSMSEKTQRKCITNGMTFITVYGDIGHHWLR